MKHLLTTALLLIALSSCMGQINLEKTFLDGEFMVSQGGYFRPYQNTEYLITFDKTNQSLKFYDDDYPFTNQ
jgi:hypothetical protein